MKKIISVVGARPNFIKIAPVHKAFQEHDSSVNHFICHTGQHFDRKMSQVFFEDLNLPKPDFYLGVNGGSQADQTARIMQEFEKIVEVEQPDLVIVPGDVTSTLACSLVAVKLGIPVAHVEAGLRSFDRSMPEEINRMVTDVISDYLFVTEQSGLDNLAHEGVDQNRIFFCGNVMIDSLIEYLPKVEDCTILEKLGLKPKEYLLVTFHRPANVDEDKYLRALVGFLQEMSQERDVVFPIHPRTKNNLQRLGLTEKKDSRLFLIEPVGYLDFLALQKNAHIVITDSGGIQEETTYLGVQCVTVRDNTERPVTVDIGTNHLAGTDLNEVRRIVAKILNGERKGGRIPEKWDGSAAARIADVLVSKLL